MLSTVRNALLHNFGLKVFALALAVGAWAYFRFSAAPGIAARFDQQLSVPIVVTGLRPGYVARYNDKFAVVTIDAPRNGGPIKPQQVQAVLNLSKQNEGVYNVPVEIIAPNLQIRSLTPASVTLAIDKLEERVLPIGISYGGDRKGIVVESAHVDPAAVTVRGIATDLARVQAVRVDVGLPNKTTTLDAMIRPVAVDVRGSEVPAVQISPNLARVRARFIPSTGSGAQ
ncbi:MAG: YbbR-like domain-containing protein [Candidatus Velthaea sp.]